MSGYGKTVIGTRTADIKSLLQKAIRRNEPHLARYAALVLLGSQCIERCVARILVMISEDIGPADTWLALEVLAVLDTHYYPTRAIKGPKGTVQPWRSMRNSLVARRMVLALATRLSLADKSRLGDNCAHGYLHCGEPCLAQPAWLSEQEQAEPAQALLPVLDLLLCNGGCCFSEAIERCGYLLFHHQTTIQELCETVVRCYGRRVQQRSDDLLDLLKALDRVRILRASGDTSKGRCTLVHMLYLVSATDAGTYELQPRPVAASLVGQVMALCDERQANVLCSTLIDGSWREAMPDWVRDHHTVGLANSALAEADWIEREDRALKPCKVVIAENAVALQAARHYHTCCDKYNSTRIVPVKSRAKARRLGKQPDTAAATPLPSSSSSSSASATANRQVPVEYVDDIDLDQDEDEEEDEDLMALMGKTKPVAKPKPKAKRAAAAAASEAMSNTAALASSDLFVYSNNSSSGRIPLAQVNLNPKKRPLVTCVDLTSEDDEEQEQEDNE
jgi:hypothetical protein